MHLWDPKLINCAEEGVELLDGDAYQKARAMPEGKATKMKRSWHVSRGAGKWMPPMISTLHFYLVILVF